MKHALSMYWCLFMGVLFSCFPNMSSGWTYYSESITYQKNYNNFWNMDYSYPTPTDYHFKIFYYTGTTGTQTVTEADMPGTHTMSTYAADFAQSIIDSFDYLNFGVKHTYDGWGTTTVEMGGTYDVYGPVGPYNRGSIAIYKTLGNAAGLSAPFSEHWWGLKYFLAATPGGSGPNHERLHSLGFGHKGDVRGGTWGNKGMGNAPCSVGITKAGEVTSDSKNGLDIVYYNDSSSSLYAEIVGTVSSSYVSFYDDGWAEAYLLNAYPATMVRAYKTTPQSIPSGSNYTKINFEGEDFDRNGEFDLTNDRFMAKQRGMYFVTISGFVSVGSGESALVGIRKNGSSIYTMKWTKYASAPNGAQPVCSVLVWLNPGDYMEGIVRHTSSVARNLNNQKELCYMDISLADNAPISNNVRASMLATQSIPVGSGYTTIQFSRQEFDTNSQYGTDTYKFQPGQAGYYLVNASGYFNLPVSGENALVGVRKDGTINIGGKWSSSGPSGIDANPICKDLVYLNGTTNYIETVARHTSSVSRNLSNDSGLTNVSITRIDAPSVSTGTRAYSSVFQSVPAGSGYTVIQFGNEDFDVNNEYNTSTYRFTAQSAGYYLVTVSGYMSTQAAEAALVGIRKNGATIIGRKWSQASNGTHAHPICTDLVYLNAGDYIEGVARHTASASRSLNNQKQVVYMNVHRVDAIPVCKRIWYQSPIDEIGTFKFRMREINGTTPFDLLLVKSFGAIKYGWPYVNGTDGHLYRCKMSHTSSASNKPITGASWSSYWERSYDGIENGMNWANNASYKAYNDSGLIEYYKTTLPVVAIGNSYIVSPQPAPISSVSSLRALQDATNYRLLYPLH